MDNFGIVVLICSLSSATESRSGSLLLLLALIDFCCATDMQMALQSKKSISGGVHSTKLVDPPPKVESTQTAAEAGFATCGGWSLMNTQFGINGLLKVVML